MCVCVCVFQVPDNAIMALVPKQVTAYNSVNNSTVSRTSASKYGKSTCFCTSLSLSGVFFRPFFSHTYHGMTHIIPLKIQHSFIIILNIIKIRKSNISIKTWNKLVKYRGEGVGNM